MVVQRRSAAVRGAMLAAAGLMLAWLASLVIQAMFHRMHQRNEVLAHQIFEPLMVLGMGSTPLSAAVLALGWPRGARGWQVRPLLRAAGLLAAVGVLSLASLLLMPLNWRLDLLLLRLRMSWLAPSLLGSTLLVDVGGSVVLLRLLGARRPWRGLAIGLAPLLMRRAGSLPVRWLLLRPGHSVSWSGGPPRWLMLLSLAASVAGLAVWGALIGLQLVAPTVEPEPSSGEPAPAPMP